MKYLKVLIGLPVSDKHAYCIKEFIESITQLNYPNYDILLIDNSEDDKFYNLIKDKINVVRKEFKTNNPKEKMVICRNMLRKRVLDENYDYFFNIDQDVIVPKDCIQKFISDNKSIVTGIYYNYFSNFFRRGLMPVIYRWWNNKEIKAVIDNIDKLKKQNPRFYESLKSSNFDFSDLRMQCSAEEVEGNKLIKIRSCGTGCIFIHKDVLKKIEFRLNPLKEGFDDMTFCEDCNEKGFEIYTDTSIKCKHLISKRPWKWKELENIK